MKVHGCASCGARFPTYNGLQEHLLTHRTVDRQSCESCRRTFSTKYTQNDICEIRHAVSRNLRNRSGKRCPSARKTRVISLNHHRNKIMTYRTCLHNTGQASVHTWREVVFKQDTITENNDTRTLELRRIYQDQTTACKINLSYGFILRHTVSDRYKYYHSSCNCSCRYLDEPSLVTNVETFEAFLERIYEQDILQWAIAQQPNSEWVCTSVTNVFFAQYCS